MAHESPKRARAAGLFRRCPVQLAVAAVGLAVAAPLRAESPPPIRVELALPTATRAVTHEVAKPPLPSSALPGSAIPGLGLPTAARAPEAPRYVARGASPEVFEVNEDESRPPGYRPKSSSRYSDEDESRPVSSSKSAVSLGPIRSMNEWAGKNADDRLPHEKKAKRSADNRDWLGDEESFHGGNVRLASHNEKGGGTAFFGGLKNFGSDIASNDGFGECDPDFDSSVSPISNPFLAEVPQTVTEIRPLYLYQKIPGGQSYFQGGRISEFDLQGRLALTRRLSVTLNRLGVITVDGNNQFVEKKTSLAEIWLGPKYTFYRDPEGETAFAAGAIFQIPTGNGGALQGTGNGGVVPYLTGSTKFLKSSYGQFNVLDTFGYSFGFGNDRSDFFYNTLALSYDIGGLNKYFPLVELNWFHYTSNGSARPAFRFEGADLANVGAPVSGRDFLNIAAGGRIKFTKHLTFGGAAVFPLTSTRDLNDFRFVFDLIYRW